MTHEHELVEARGVDVVGDRPRAVGERHRLERRGVTTTTGQVDGDGRRGEVGEERIPTATVQPAAVDEHHGCHSARRFGREHPLGEPPSVVGAHHVVLVGADDRQRLPVGQQDVGAHGGGVARDVDDGIGDHVASPVDGGRERDQRLTPRHQVAGGVEHGIGRERVRPTLGVAVVDRVVVPVEQLQDLVAILGGGGHGVSSSYESLDEVVGEGISRRYGAISSGVAASTPPSTGRVTPVIQRASSLARNTAAAATSQAVPSAPRRLDSGGEATAELGLGCLAEHRVEQRRGDVTGRDRVDTNALATVRVGHVDGERVHTALRRRVADVAVAAQRGDRPDVHDRACTLGGHDRHRVLGREERGAQADRDAAIPSRPRWCRRRCRGSPRRCC